LAHRTQARTIQEIERQTLYDVTRQAIIEAISFTRRHPRTGCFRGFGPWPRGTL
jgi:hypothetical protein